MQPDKDPLQPVEIYVVPEGAIDLIDREPVQPPIPPPRPVRRFRSRKRLALLLFVATCLSTFLVGMGHTDPDTATGLLPYLVNGVAYSAPLMLILLAHEMGHYLQARRYGVPATLPLFIPMPFTPIGTMGAVIVQGAGFADRKALFDIAVSGPLAGLLLALPTAWWGMQMSEVMRVGPDSMLFGDPLILKWMIALRHGPLAEGQEVLLNPMLFAGWVGIFITALNLIPIGQLDGGHILYTLLGRRAHIVAVALLWTAVGYMVYSKNPAYGAMVVLLFLMGPRHPPTADDHVPLGAGRILLGWLTLGFIVLGFTLEPLSIGTRP